MRALHHPDLASVDLATFLGALADPVRQSVVRQLAASGGAACGEFDALSLVSMSTLSQHLKILRQSGVLRVTPRGTFRIHELRSDEAEERFPGILAAVVANLSASRVPAPS